MGERFSTWHDDDVNDWGEDEGVTTTDYARATAALSHAEEDEYVRLYSREDTRSAHTSTVIDLESDDDEGNDLASSTTLPKSEEPAGGAEAPSAASIQAALARFGHTALRGLQGPALRSVFAGRDTVVLLPTGGGKSLCFQLPAVMQPGLVVVISPLLALMQDQVVALRRRKIRVAMLCSLVGAKEKRDVHDRLLRDASFPGRADSVEILYTTPETLPTQSLQATLKALHRQQMLALFAIDEAHCISSWGHDFRPAYLKLGAIRETFPEVPIMALTATATSRVREDIRAELQLRPDTTELMGDFNRANISYSVHNKDLLGDKVGALLKFIKRCHRGSVGIVYVHRRLDTESLVESLQTRDDSIRAAPYHAEIPLKQREQTLLDWLRGKIDIICATIAFGMGIDHPSVRFVVHWNMPKTMENLYQEAGRAGRDGHASHHVLLYSHEEYQEFQDLLRMAEDDLLEKERSGKRGNKKRVVTLRDRLKRLEKVLHYAIYNKCRRRSLLEYFGQNSTEALCGGTCDYCNEQLLFKMLSPLTSHRPEANTYHPAPGEAPYKWRRQRRGAATTDDDSLQNNPVPMEAVPRYTGRSMGVDSAMQMPQFDLGLVQTAVRATSATPIRRFGLDARPTVPPSATPPRLERSAVSDRFDLNARPTTTREMPRPFQRPPAPSAPPSPPRNWRRTFDQSVPAGVRTIADYIAATAHRRRPTLRGWSADALRDFDDSGGSDESDSSDADVKFVDARNVKREPPLLANASRRAKRPRSTAGAEEIIVIDDSD